MVSVAIVTNFLSIMTLIGSVLVIAFLLIFILNKSLRRRFPSFEFVENNALFFAFLIALAATIGSLFYSEIAGYAPCKLCWFQRVFIYPQVILLGVALIQKARDVFYYVLPLNIIGGALAVYHSYVQRVGASTSCSLDGGVSCVSKYVFDYGFVTIPVMAVIAFALIIIFTYLDKEKKTRV